MLMIGAFFYSGLEGSAPSLSSLDLKKIHPNTRNTKHIHFYDHVQTQQSTTKEKNVLEIS